MSGGNDIIRPARAGDYAEVIDRHRLVAFAEDEARRLGYEALDLYSHVTMTENIALHGALGCVEIERRVVSGDDRIYMRKILLA